MHIKAAQHKLCYHAKLGEEKLAFQKAPGKLEPRWQSTKVKLVTVKLVRCEKLAA